MLQFNINLTSLAVILWSGMLIIAGSVLVLSSQVRKVADLMEEHSSRTAASTRSAESVHSARLPRAVARRERIQRRVLRSDARNSTA